MKKVLVTGGAGFIGSHKLDIGSHDLKILLIGQTEPQDITPSYKKAFEYFGCEVLMINPYDYYTAGLFNRALNKMLTFLINLKERWGVRIYLNTESLNEMIFEKIKEFSPRFIVFNKPVFIKPFTVKNIQNEGIKVFAYYPDDPFNPRTTSRDLQKATPLYDCHFTTKSYTVSELLEAGAKKVVFIPHASDTTLYYPEETLEEERKKIGADVVFIGSYYEKYRAEILEKLCQRGYDLKVYGNRWGKCRGFKCLKEKALMYKPVEADEYRRVMNSSKIALGLLAKVIPEQHTHRTFEIPACGTFMLHERTKEAMDLFKKGEEAEFFGSFEELVEKIDYYLKHDEERKRIARNGHKKASSYEYSYLARTQRILDVYSELKGNESNHKEN